MRRLLACVLLCLSLLPGFGIFITAAQSSSAHKLIELVNEYRASHGVPPLEINNSLMAAAQRHANWMAANYAHSHQGEGGSMPQDRATAAGYQGLVSENVASGTLSYVTPAWAVEGWAGSPGHRRTMLSNNVHVGAGIALNEEEEFYVLVIGSPSEFAPKPPAGAQTAPEEDSEEAEAEPIIVVPIELAEPREDGSVVHVVQQGQTAWAIAARYGVPLDELMAINHLDRNAVLYPGDEIIARLGEGQSPPPPPTLPATHIVGKPSGLSPRFMG
jgi:LysM repeat protein